MKRLWSAAVLLSLLSGCEPKELNFSLNIVTQSCDPAADPFNGVQFLQVRVTGKDMDPKIAVSAANPATRTLKIPEIPSGLERVIEVRGYDADPSSGGKVVSVGRTLPFEVCDVVPKDGETGCGSLKKNVILRKVNTFAPIVSAASPSQCQALRVERAGHTATLLKSGKVFIAGGFNLKQGTAERKALADVEIYNPETGAFELGKPLSITAQGSVIELPIAYHAAIRIPNGQIVVWGGETYGVNNVPGPKTTVLFYDETVDDYGALGPRDPPAIARSHHRLAMDANGKVLVAGGIKAAGRLADEVEWLDTATNLSRIVGGAQISRLGATVMPVKNGEFIAVAGGSNGSAMQNDVVFFKYTGMTFAQQSLSTPPRLAEPGRREAAGALIRDGADLLLLGGYTDPSTASTTTPTPSASSEVLNGAAGSLGAGPDVRTARGEICATTMGDGTVLASGGRTVDGLNPRSDATAVLISASPNGGVTSIGGPNLPRARYGHTCTTLADGTVLVTGGLNESTDGSIEILKDAYIYTPVPAAD